jgi:hypothetical protein
MFESAGPANKLDAIVGVTEVETGYRDRWRIWLARGGVGERRRPRRVLKTRGLLAGWMARVLLRIVCRE